MLLKKIDRYVLKSFAAWFLVCLVGLMGLYVVVDMFLRLHKFFKFSGAEIVYRIFWYYLWNIPFNFLEYLPLVTLMAGMFTVAMMAKSNELVPIIASGISIYRVTANIFACAVLVMIVMFALQELYVPHFADTIANASDKPRTEARAIRDLKIADNARSIFHYRSFDPVKEQMNAVTITRWDERYRETHYIFAERAAIGEAQMLTEDDGTRTYGFEHNIAEDEILLQVQVRGGRMFRLIKKKNIETEGPPLTLKNGTRIEGYEYGLSPDEMLFRNGSWARVIPRSKIKKIEKKRTWILHNGVDLDYTRMAQGDETHKSPPWQFRFNDYDMVFPSDLEVVDLKVKKTEPRFRSFAELNEQIERYPVYDTWKVALYRRITLPLTNLILLLVGLPFVMRMDKKSVFASLGVCILIFLCFFVLSFICHDLGAHKRMPPTVAVALPLVVFTTLGLYKFDSMRT
ncbi:MAG: LptF/LptG family permease [Planctomycetota bacterium]